MTAGPDWLVQWYKPEPTDIIAYISEDRIAEIGGTTRQQYQDANVSFSINQINKGMVVLNRWFRLNCTSMPRAVNVMGRTGFAFKNNDEAVLFKLVWG